MKTGQFTIYKSKGAAQFSMILPKFNDKGFMEKEGAILLQVAPGDGNRDNPTWDWNRKISFAISTTDIGNIFDQTNPKANRIFHKHQEISKTLEFIPGKDNYEGTFMLSVNQGSGENRSQVTVPLTNGEYQVIMRLFAASLTTLIAWK